MPIFRLRSTKARLSSESTEKPITVRIKIGEGSVSVKLAGSNSKVSVDHFVAVPLTADQQRESAVHAASFFVVRGEVAFATGSQERKATGGYQILFDERTGITDLKPLPPPDWVFRELPEAEQRAAERLADIAPARRGHAAHLARGDRHRSQSGRAAARGSCTGSSRSVLGTYIALEPPEPGRAAGGPSSYYAPSCAVTRPPPSRCRRNWPISSTIKRRLTPSSRCCAVIQKSAT